MEKWGWKPEMLIACIGRGTNAIGLFHEFVDDLDVRLIGVEAAGLGKNSGKTVAALSFGDVGVFYGRVSYLLQEEDWNITEPYSISTGLEYHGVGPEHSFLKESGQAEYYSVTDGEALEAFKRVVKLEGIIPALETSLLERLCPSLEDGTRVVFNCSGNGEKDVHMVFSALRD